MRIDRYIPQGDPIDAVIVTADNAKDVAKWCGGLAIEDRDALTRDGKMFGVNVPTLFGVERASEGYYVAKDAAGRFSVHLPREFDEQYKKIGVRGFPSLSD